MSAHGLTVETANNSTHSPNNAMLLMVEIGFMVLCYYNIGVMLWFGLKHLF